MSWDPSKALARPLLAAALLLTATSALADILVVRSAGPSAGNFPPGKRLAETERIDLRKGDQLVVLDGRGTRVVRGPGRFVAGGPPAGRADSSGPAGQRRSRIGAVRGSGGGELRPPSIWHVDVSKSSNVCVAHSSKVILWRADPAQASTSAVEGPGGRTGQLRWAAGSSTLAWPSELPIADGAEYRLSRPGRAAPTVLRFKTLPATPAGLEDMAQALIRNRCEAQLDHFIETVKLPE